MTREEAMQIPELEEKIERLEWLDMECGELGLTAYKAFLVSDKGKYFGPYYPCNSDWIIAPGSVLSAGFLDRDPAEECGHGVHLGTTEWIEEWVDDDTLDAITVRVEIWECFIPYEDFGDVVVPTESDGKIRALKLKLVEKVAEAATFREPNPDYLGDLDMDEMHREDFDYNPENWSCQA